MSTAPPTKRPKTGGGSRKGKPNKKTEMTRAGVQALCDKHDYDPWEAMIIMAKAPNTEDTIRLQCHKEIAQYLLAKLRSVELTGNPDRPVRLDVCMTLRQALDKAYGIQERHRNGQAPPCGIVAASANGH